MSAILTDRHVPADQHLCWGRLRRRALLYRSLYASAVGGAVPMAAVLTHDDGGWLPVVVSSGPAGGVASGPRLRTRRAAVRWAESVLARDGLPLAAMVMLGDPAVAALASPLARLLAAAPMAGVSIGGTPPDSAGEARAVVRACTAEPQRVAEVRHDVAGDDRAVAMAMILALAALMRLPGDAACPGTIEAAAISVFPQADPEPGEPGRIATAIAQVAGLDVASAALRFRVHGAEVTA